LEFNNLTNISIPATELWRPDLVLFNKLVLLNVRFFFSRSKSLHTHTHTLAWYDWNLLDRNRTKKNSFIFSIVDWLYVCFYCRLVLMGIMK